MKDFYEILQEAGLSYRVLCNQFGDTETVEVEIGRLSDDVTLVFDAYGRLKDVSE